MSDFDVSALDSPFCALRPYVRGHVARDALYWMWRAMEEDAAADKVFHGQLPGNLPFSLRGDLPAFCAYFSEPGRLTAMVFPRPPEELAGFIWFDDLVPGFRANANLFFRRKYRGAVALEAGKLALRYAFEGLGLQELWAFTPWREAAGYARRLGFQPVATLPKIVQAGEQRADMQVLRLGRID